MSTQSFSYFASQYRRSRIIQRDVTAPTMNVSRDFRRRIAANTLLTCSKVTARIEITHACRFHMWKCGFLDGANWVKRSYRGYSTAKRTNLGGYISEDSPLISQSAVRFLSMAYDRIDLHMKTLITSTISSST